MSVHEALEHPWLLEQDGANTKRIPASRYKAFLRRLQLRYVSCVQDSMFIF